MSKGTFMSHTFEDWIELFTLLEGYFGKSHDFAYIARLSKFLHKKQVWFHLQLSFCTPLYRVMRNNMILVWKSPLFFVFETYFLTQIESRVRYPVEKNYLTMMQQNMTCTCLLTKCPKKYCHVALLLGKPHHIVSSKILLS